MRALVTAAVIALLTTPAFAQSMNILNDRKKLMTEEEVRAQQERDSAYKDAISKMPAQKPTNDPWGHVRGPAPSNQAGARPGAK